MKALTQQEEDFALPLTPLIDVVFLLIVFFLVSTSFVRPEKSIDIQLPISDEAAKAPEEEQTLVVNVQESGLVVVHGRVLAGYDELVETIQKAHRTNPSLIVVIRGDRRTMHRDIVRVMNAALAVGIGEMSIAVFETENR